MESGQHRLEELLYLKVLHLVGLDSLKRCIYGKDDAVGWNEAKAIFINEEVTLEIRLGGDSGIARIAKNRFFIANLCDFLGIPSL